MTKPPFTLTGRRYEVLKVFRDGKQYKTNEIAKIINRDTPHVGNIVQDLAYNGLLKKETIRERYFPDGASISHVGPRIHLSITEKGLRYLNGKEKEIGLVVG